MRIAVSRQKLRLPQKLIQSIESGAQPPSTEEEQG
jgi:hypothetical protein